MKKRPPDTRRPFSLRTWAARLMRDVALVWLAARNPHVPRLARLVGAVTLAYALSPIDLIPDVIPILGLLDDMVLVPLGLAWAIALIPAPLRASLRDAAAGIELPTGSKTVILATWALVLLLSVIWVYA